MSETDMNLRLAAVSITDFVIAIFSWLTPYPWYTDAAIVAVIMGVNIIYFATKGA